MTTIDSRNFTMVAYREVERIDSAFVSWLMNSSRTPRQRTSMSHHARSPALTSKLSKHPRHRSISFSKFPLLLLCLFVLNCSAHLIQLLDEQMIEGDDVEPLSLDSPAPREKFLPNDDLLRSALQRLAESGTIVVDQRPPPASAPSTTWELGDFEDEIKRQMRKRATSTADSSASSTAAIATATDTASSSLPTPFDSGFSNNITSSCSTFMNGFLNNATFKSCLPFSLLLQSSNSFFQIEKSLVRTTQLLDYTCAVDVNSCTAYTASLASNITQTEHCASDLSNENPLILQALLGLEAYQMLYQASCLKNADSGAYCFADAVTNASSPTDSYPYYLPLNVTLPGGSQPTCNTCLQDTMTIFASAGANRSLAIASTYTSAAQLINMNCGPTFVNSSLPSTAVSTSAAVGRGSPGIIALFVMCIGWMMVIFS